jgi:hypothetical protein
MQHHQKEIRQGRKDPPVQKGSISLLSEFSNRDRQFETKDSVYGTKGPPHPSKAGPLKVFFSCVPFHLFFILVIFSYSKLRILLKYCYTFLHIYIYMCVCVCQKESVLVA